MHELLSNFVLNKKLAHPPTMSLILTSNNSDLERVASYSVNTTAFWNHSCGKLLYAFHQELNVIMIMIMIILLDTNSICADITDS